MSIPKTFKSLRFIGVRGKLDVHQMPSFIPVPSDEIIVKVKAASINPVDVQLWGSGLVAVVPGDAGMGKDFSGTVVAVGKNVTGWAEGDDIFGLFFDTFGQGTFSEYLHFSPKNTQYAIAKNPGCFSHETAASIPLVALTAYACLDWLPPPGTSQRRIVIRGASGGTGSILIQLAKLSYDCHVTAICSAKNAEYVQKLGADEVIDYTSQNVVETLSKTRATSQPYDLIIDCVGGVDFLGSYQELLHPKGGYITIVGDKSDVKALGGPITYITKPAQILRYIKGYIWGPRYACVSFYTKSELLERIVGLGERGELKMEIQEVIPGIFDSKAAMTHAIDLIESGRIRGKVVLSIP